MKTTITINSLQVACTLGVSAQERSQKQEIFVTIKLYIDADLASKTDKVTDTVNYRAVYNTVITIVERSHFHLLEALASHIADSCLAFLGVKKVMVIVTKPAILANTQAVSVAIEKEHE